MDPDSLSLMQTLVEAVSMPTTPLESRTDGGEPPPETNEPMDKQGIKLEEKLWVEDCYLFQDESLAPIFCKSKLIPLKTITTQKLEKMQKELMEKVEIIKQPSEKPTDIEEEPEDVPSASEPKEADVWTADD